MIERDMLIVEPKDIQGPRRIPSSDVKQQLQAMLDKCITLEDYAAKPASLRVKKSRAAPRNTESPWTADIEEN
jgi:hypothetical protein